MKKILLGVGIFLSVGILSGVSFSANTVQYQDCFKYNCAYYFESPPLTFVWIDGVDVWVASDFPDKYIPLVKRAVKMYNAVANIGLIFRGKSDKPVNFFFDTKNCNFKDQNWDLFPKGITVIHIPSSCKGKVLTGLDYGFTIQVPLSTVNGKPVSPHQASSLIAVYEDVPESIGNLLVYIHEFGHALGFVHVRDVGIDPNTTISVMSWSVPITEEDKTVLQAYYGVPNTNDSMEVFEFNTYRDTFVARTENGVCVAGGVYPFTAMVISGNCEVKPVKDVAVSCWEVYGNPRDKCTIRVVDKNNNSAEYTITIQGLNFIDNNPPDETDGTVYSGGSGGGGGCNTGSYEMAIAGLLAFLGKVIRRGIRRKRYLNLALRNM